MAARAPDVPSRYLTRLVTTTNGARLVSAGVFPNAKEVTESYGARQVLARLPELDPDDGKVAMVSVGDGTTPRTAATYAVTTRWTCHSVDPRLRVRKRWSGIDRLHVHPIGVEDMSLSAPTVVVVMVHSHVDAATALRSVNADRVVLISMPCCVPPGLATAPDMRYRDLDIGSPENEILVWRNPRPGVVC